MTPTEFPRTRRRHPASADICRLLLGACFAVSAQAADAPVAVIAPKPAVIQPTTMAPPPTAPEAIARPAAKSGAKPKKAVKATGKPKVKSAKSRQR